MNGAEGVRTEGNTEIGKYGNAVAWRQVCLALWAQSLRHFVSQPLCSCSSHAPCTLPYAPCSFTTCNTLSLLTFEVTAVLNKKVCARSPMGRVPDFVPTGRTSFTGPGGRRDAGRKRVPCHGAGLEPILSFILCAGKPTALPDHPAKSRISYYCIITHVDLSKLLLVPKGAPGLFPANAWPVPGP